jgi:hypothetical protein
MEGRAVVQANSLAEIGQRDSVAIASHLFQNGESASYRLDAPARPILNVIIDVWQRIFDNTRNCQAAARRKRSRRVRFRFRRASQNDAPKAWRSSFDID